MMKYFCDICNEGLIGSLMNTIEYRGKYVGHNSWDNLKYSHRCEKLHLCDKHFEEVIDLIKRNKK